MGQKRFDFGAKQDAPAGGGVIERPDAECVAGEQQRPASHVVQCQRKIAVQVLGEPFAAPPVQGKNQAGVRRVSRNVGDIVQRSQDVLAIVEASIEQKGKP